MSGDPYPKSKQLARGTRRYRRKVASPKQWQAIQAAKIGPCRICRDPASNGKLYGRVHMHHVVPRSRGGDDIADNIVPLCPDCHDKVTRHDAVYLVCLELSLTAAERAYALTKRRRA